MRSLVVLAALAALLVTASAPAAARHPVRRDQRVVLTVTKNGFEPATVRVKAGQPVTLVVTRVVERTCATDIVIKDYGIRKPLPLKQAVVIRLTPRHPGAIRYACARDMVAGTLVAE